MGDELAARLAWTGKRAARVAGAFAGPQHVSRRRDEAAGRLGHAPLPHPPGALPRFFQVVRDRGGAHRLDVPELDGLVREQADRPVVVALRRVRAREGDDPRLDVPVDLEVSR